jgi:6-phosphogluconolactonase
MASIHVSDNPQALARAAAEFICKLARDTIRRRGRFALALSGGSTPQLTYEYMRHAEGQPDWSRMYFFWSDERCVPGDHPDSNYRLAHETLLAHVPVHPTHIQRMDCNPSPEAGAERYEARLREWIRTNGEPVFDLVMLGLGRDGHTASLFPGTLALDEEDHLVAANWVEKLDTWRLTLTLPALNAAAAVAFLVEGSGKASIVRAALAGPPARLPAQRVSPEHGDLHWFLDRAAAAELPPGLAGSVQPE